MATADEFGAARVCPSPAEDRPAYPKRAADLRKTRHGNLTATARIVHRGRRVIVTDVDITNNGVLCGKALASFMLTTAASAES